MATATIQLSDNEAELLAAKASAERLSFEDYVRRLADRDAQIPAMPSLESSGSRWHSHERYRTRLATMLIVVLAAVNNQGYAYGIVAV